MNDSSNYHPTNLNPVNNKNPLSSHLHQWNLSTIQTYNSPTIKIIMRFSDLVPTALGIRFHPLKLLRLGNDELRAIEIDSNILISQGRFRGRRVMDEHRGNGRNIILLRSSAIVEFIWFVSFLCGYWRRVGNFI